MLMTGDEIRTARVAGEIVIEPFCEENVNTVSYDVTLGPFYYRQVPAQRRGRPFVQTKHGIVLEAVEHYNQFDQQHVEASWCLDRAIEAGSSSEDLDDGIDPQDFVIPLPPKAIILAHTLEFIGSVPRPRGISITTQMHSRSSSVRNCIDVCGSGGFGDSGFCNRWTLEIINTSQHYTNYLVVGRRYAQISFWRTTPILRNYAVEGKYHAGLDLDQLRRQWQPSMMLPRSYQDREVDEPNQHRELIQELIHKYPIER